MNRAGSIAMPRTEGFGASHGGPWLKPLNGWLGALRRSVERDPAVVRVVVASVRGSAPREAGVGMLVARGGTLGTIGGGRLEWEAVAAARHLLEISPSVARLERVVLGADRGQCCGGVVELWMERYTPADGHLLEQAQHAARRGPAMLECTMTPRGVERRIVERAGADADSLDLLRTPRGVALPRLSRTAAGEWRLLERLDEALPPLWLYGAGHVGQALARIVMELPVRLTWIDSRAGQFPGDVPAAVDILQHADPAASVAQAPAGARFLVMTHSHPLDYALCRAILERADFAWAGLIGSLSKAARFRSRLRRDGVGEGSIARLVCPIGIGGITSKWPTAIAVSVAAQLMQDLSDTAARLPPAQAPAAAPRAHECAHLHCSNCGTRAC